MAQTITAPPTAQRSDRTPEPVGERILVCAFSTYDVLVERRDAEKAFELLGD